MPKYHVIDYKTGIGNDWAQMDADTDQEAAEKVTGVKLRRSGTPQELRARVRLDGKLRVKSEFYTDVKAKRSM